MEPSNISEWGDVYFLIQSQLSNWLCFTSCQTSLLGLRKRKSFLVNGWYLRLQFCSELFVKGSIHPPLVIDGDLEWDGFTLFLLLPCFYKTLRFMFRITFHSIHASCRKHGGGTTDKFGLNLLWSFLGDPIYQSFKIICKRFWCRTTAGWTEGAH